MQARLVKSLMSKNTSMYYGLGMPSIKLAKKVVKLLGKPFQKMRGVSAVSHVGSMQVCSRIKQTCLLLANAIIMPIKIDMTRYEAMDIAFTKCAW